MLNLKSVILIPAEPRHVDAAMTGIRDLKGAESG